MSPSLADQLLGKGMNELDISLVLARLQDEHYQLDTTEFLADVLAPNRIQAIETFIWVHLKASFVGKAFALDPSFLKAHVDWASAWRQVRQHHGIGCVQLPKEPDQTLVQFVFVAGPNALCPDKPALNRDQGDSTCTDQLIWEP